MSSVVMARRKGVAACGASWRGRGAARGGQRFSSCSVVASSCSSSLLVSPLPLPRTIPLVVVIVVVTRPVALPAVRAMPLFDSASTSSPGPHSSTPTTKPPSLPLLSFAHRTRYPSRSPSLSPLFPSPCVCVCVCAPLRLLPHLVLLFCFLPPPPPQNHTCALPLSHSYTPTPTQPTKKGFPPPTPLEKNPLPAHAGPSLSLSSSWLVSHLAPFSPLLPLNPAPLLATGARALLR